MTGPLDGIRVLELGNFIAAPFAGRVFADFGADVIKVERPGGGDELRGWRSLRGGTSMLWRTIGRNKRSVTLDLRKSAGQRLIRKLVAKCDVVLENFRPGTLERWNLGPTQLQAVNPELVLVRISGYGQTGPYADRAGFGGVAEAFGGLRYVTGDPASPPSRSATSIGDEVAGLYAVIGALMAMLARVRNRQAVPIVDVALYEAVFSLMESLVPDYDAYGVVRERTGGNLPGVAPSGVFPCKEGHWVVIGGNANAVFARLMRAIGRPDLADDPDLADGPGRGRRSDELNAIIAGWTADHRVEEVLDVLTQAGVPAGPVNDASAIAADPHFQARGMLVTHEVEVDGSSRPVRFPGVVPKIPAAPGRMRWPGPELGAHNDEVFRDLLDVSADELADLRAEGVIS
ncbi:CaiB/BaiF CoA transferase family protein [Fodinicola acaciae]|uniref:CaiB/BaiF CoA transferase family protein n=1 Tax=Fodinicola acaciae TaxID=2681555 RepID=UPI0013D574A4|nr:CaiB/BaiF CoA-transferase family protein [Fodinicola acaciae]